MLSSQSSKVQQSLTRTSPTCVHEHLLNFVRTLCALAQVRKQRTLHQEQPPPQQYAQLGGGSGLPEGDGGQAAGRECRAQGQAVRLAVWQQPSFMVPDIFLVLLVSLTQVSSSS